MRLLRWGQGLAWRSRRAWELLRLYWSTEDCDWSTIALLMRHQIRRTRLHVQEHDKVAGVERVARQMLTAETLLGRMLHEDCSYSDIAAARHPKGSRPWALLWRSLERQDDEMLATLLRKHLRSWWD